MDVLKSALISDTLLIYPDFDQPFILATDASGEGMGAVLSQKRDGYERPIGYVSKQFNKAERNYSTIEKELYGIVFGVKSFKCYLHGHRFTIVTDHRPLKWLLSLKDPSSRLTRWAMMFSEYNYEVVHRPGRLHSNRFGGVEHLVNQNKSVGDVACLRRFDRNIYYLVTKVNYYDKPSYADLWEAIKALRRECDKNEETAVALPKIGCGLDGLQWEVVFDVIKFVFMGAIQGSRYIPSRAGRRSMST